MFINWKQMISERAKQILIKYREVDHYLKQVVQYMDPDKVILYGSKATGNADKSSDTDLAVITNHFYTTEIYGAVDIMDFNRAPEKVKQLILKEGIVLYER